MKNILSICFVASAFCLNAQVHPGFIAGGVSSNLNTDFFETKARTGFLVGLSFFGESTEKLSFLSEFTMEQGGANTTTFREVVDEVTYDLPYKQYVGTATYNLMADYKVYERLIGLQFGIHFHMVGVARETGDSFLRYGTPESQMQNPEGITMNTVGVNEVADKLRRMNGGLSAGFSLANDEQSLVLSVRYNYGLRMFNNRDAVDYQQQYTFTRSAITVSLAYHFMNVIVM